MEEDTGGRHFYSFLWGSADSLVTRRVRRLGSLPEADYSVDWHEATWLMPVEEGKRKLEGGMKVAGY